MSAIWFTEAELEARAAKILAPPRLPPVSPTGEVYLRNGPFLGASDFAKELRALGAASAAVAMIEARGIRSVDILAARNRLGRIAMARHELQAWLYRHVPGISYPEIGRMFGGRDHTTVMSAVRKIDRLSCENERIARRQAIPRDALDP